MKVTTACQCIITFSLVGIPIAVQGPAAAASGSGTQASAPEERKPSPPGAASPNAQARGAAPTGKPVQPRMRPNPAQEVEERVRSGQMDQPIAQGAISERLNQLQSGLNSSSDDAAASRSGR